MLNRLFISAVLLLLSVLGASAQTGTWSGKLDVQGTKLTLVFHLDGDKPCVDSPDQGVKGIPVQVEKNGISGLLIKIPSLGASFEGMMVVQKIVGTFKQGGLSLPLVLTPGEDKPKRPQTPVGPFPYSQEEVSFVRGDYTFNGTLTLPEGYSRKTPVLVMVTGSGIQNRDEEIFDHKPFAVIADALARAGVASLRYDDRGYGGAAADVATCTADDFKSDALAAVDMLRERFDKVGVLGHSEGGTIAFLLAAQKKVDFVVSLAGVVVSGAEALVWQNRLGLLEAGFAADVVDRYCNALDQAFKVKVEGGVMPKAENLDLPDVLKQNFLAVLVQIQSPYFAHFLSLDVRKVLTDVVCPVLAMNGTKDVQVDHVANLAALREGLVENDKNDVVAVEGVNHLFQRCATGSVQEYRTIEETIFPEVLGRLVAWVAEFK